jgi:hypothetical protein
MNPTNQTPLTFSPILTRKTSIKLILSYILAVASSIHKMPRRVEPMGPVVGVEIWALPTGADGKSWKIE